MPMEDVERGFAEITGLPEPNPMQRKVWQHICTDPWGTGLLLQAPTGSGKTEAVAVPALALGDRRLIMVYPCRSLVEDQIGRFERMLAACSAQDPARPYALVIDTGADTHRLLWKAGQPIAVGNPRRHLYHGDVIVTTLDKFLYRFFGFGEPVKSYIYPLRIHYGARRSLICFDEAHAYEDVAFSNFARLVRALYRKGIDVVVMTATMPREFAAELGYLDLVDYATDAARRDELAAFTRARYPSRQYPSKTLHLVPVAIEPSGDSALAPAMQRILKLAEEEAAPDKRLIVTVERVTDAVALYRRLQGNVQAEVLLYHGRLTAEQRRAVYRRLASIESARGGCLLVSTSAIEVGCDLDAHVLITQLCDPDSLIQRAGRCNRRQETPHARVYVVGDTVPAWVTTLHPDDLAHYLDVLRAQDGKPLDVSDLVECIRKRPNPDYRVEIMFDMLYEYVYEARMENKGLHERGLVVTRSWEPSLTLCTGERDGCLLNAVQVPMSHCIAGEGEALTPDCVVYKQSFHPQDHTAVREPLGRWDCAYSVDVVVQVPPESFDPTIGYAELPTVFNRTTRAGYRRILVREEGDSQSQLWYLAPLAPLPETGPSETLEQEDDEEDVDAD